MAVDRKTVAQVLVSVIAVALLIAGLIMISGMYGANNGGETQISPEGGLYLIGLLAVFIVIMPIFGYIVERTFPDEDDD